MFEELKDGLFAILFFFGVIFICIDEVPPFESDKIDTILNAFEQVVLIELKRSNIFQQQLYFSKVDIALFIAHFVKNVIEFAKQRVHHIFVVVSLVLAIVLQFVLVFFQVWNHHFFIFFDNRFSEWFGQKDIHIVVQQSLQAFAIIETAQRVIFVEVKVS